ncbi:MAG: hypothetical protein ACOYYS_19210 [Chloroflexota bacterium]
MRHPEGIEDYTQELAVYLTIETGDLYTAEITPGAWYQIIHGPKDTYHVSFDDDRTVVTTSNPAELNPHTNHYNNARATFATSRSLIAIAKDMVRRLRPTAQAQREAALQEKARHDAATAKTAAAVEALRRWMKPYPHGNTDRRVALYSKQTRVEIQDGTIYDMKISALTAEQAADILELIEGV